MFSLRLKASRKAKKLTQEELATLIKTTKGTISNYENGHSTPSNEALVLLAKSLDVSTDYLLGISDFPKDTKEFEKFKNNPTLERWFKELPNNEEEDLEALKDMWEIIQRNKNK